jgi:TetR/AcrR family transcriptional regulator, regulator of cefoperazone and chloramphenicol sensitivity
LNRLIQLETIIMMRTLDADGTRKRLLKAACELFAERGYASSSLADITRLAGANKAAVNYHFGSKEELYQEAWRHAHERLMAQVPPDGGVPADRPAEERLRGRIRAGLQRAIADDAIEFGIMRNEMANPTGLLHRVIDDAINPIRQATQAILRELLGPRATDLDVQFCEVCVVAPWMHLTHHRQAVKHKGLAPVFREDVLDAMVDHFAAFALAGIAEVRRRIERGAGAASETAPTAPKE